MRQVVRPAFVHGHHSSIRSRPERQRLPGSRLLAHPVAVEFLRIGCLGGVGLWPAPAFSLPPEAIGRFHGSLADLAHLLIIRSNAASSAWAAPRVRNRIKACLCSHRLMEGLEIDLYGTST